MTDESSGISHSELSEMVKSHEEILREMAYISGFHDAKQAAISAIKQVSNRIYVDLDLSDDVEFLERAILRRVSELRPIQ